VLRHGGADGRAATGGRPAALGCGMDILDRFLFGDTSAMMLGEVIVRLLAATVCGAMIGVEREARDKPAGLRTVMLVSISACAFTVLALELATVSEETVPNARPDPVRVVEAVVTGVAFLGAGSIIRAGASVHGVTTGATIWLVGAIGTACGAGLLGIGLAVTLLSLFVLVVLGWIERHVAPWRHRTPDEKGDRTSDRDADGGAG
jgi:putative Mg2+ transporter-C (MgtC) family protein